LSEKEIESERQIQIGGRCVCAILNAVVANYVAHTARCANCN